MKNIITLIALAFGCMTSHADDFYSKGELSVSPFATIRTPNFEDFTEGYGVGVSYAYHRHWLIEGRALHDGFDIDGQTIGDIGGRIVGRLPLSNGRTAPYIFTGAGWSFDRDTVRIETGVGLEQRFTQRFGAYAEFGHHADFQGGQSFLGSAGLRITF